MSHDVFGVTSRDLDLARRDQRRRRRPGGGRGPRGRERGRDRARHPGLRDGQAVLARRAGPRRQSRARPGAARPVRFPADAVVPADRAARRAAGSGSTSTCACRPRSPRSASPRPSTPAGCWSATSAAPRVHGARRRARQQGLHHHRASAATETRCRGLRHGVPDGGTPDTLRLTASGRDRDRRPMCTHLLVRTRRAG